MLNEFNSTDSNEIISKAFPGIRIVELKR